MKYFTIILTLLISFSCSHKTVNRSPQSVGLPVMEIAADPKQASEVRAGEFLKVKFTLLDSLGSPVSGKVVNFYFSGNNGHFEQNQVTSNVNGVVENIFVAHPSEQDSSKRVSYEVYVERALLGRLTSTQFLMINADYKQLILKRFSSISLVSSSFEWVGEKNLLADEKKEYILAFVPRDQSGNIIKSDGKFNVNLITENGNTLNGVFYSDQTYRYKISGNKVFGKKVLKVLVKNSYTSDTHFIPDFIADFKPVFNFEKIKILKTETSSKVFSAKFSILDINENVVSEEYLPSVDVTDEIGQNVSLERDHEVFSISGEFPYGKGQKDFEIIIAKEKIKSPLSFHYNNLEIDWTRAELSLDKTYVHPFFVKPQVYGIDQELENTHFILKLVDIKGNPLTSLEELGLNLGTTQGSGVFSQVRTPMPGEFHGIFSPENNEFKKIVFFLKNAEIKKEFGIVLNTGFVPQKSVIINKETVTSMAYANELTLNLAEDDLKRQIITGFSLVNKGGNSVVPVGASCDSDPQDNFQARRTYYFEFEDQARQGIKLYVRDDTSSWDSKNRHSSFYFFPRKVIPSFKFLSKNEMEIILPTEEKISVNRLTGEFFSNQILEEGKVDLGTGYPACTQRTGITKKFPSLTYKGKGIILKVNNFTGSSMPEESNRDLTAQVYYFDEINQKMVNCPKLLKTDFFTNGVLKFSTDQDFADFLKIKCGEEFFRRLKVLLVP